jgi:hypothetical protein
LDCALAAADFVAAADSEFVASVVDSAAAAAAAVEAVVVSDAPFAFDSPASAHTDRGTTDGCSRTQPPLFDVGGLHEERHATLADAVAALVELELVVVLAAVSREDLAAARRRNYLDTTTKE